MENKCKIRPNKGLDKEIKKNNLMREEKSQITIYPNLDHCYLFYP